QAAGGDRDVPALNAVAAPGMLPHRSRTRSVHRDRSGDTDRGREVPAPLRPELSVSGVDHRARSSAGWRDERSAATSHPPSAAATAYVLSRKSTTIASGSRASRT